MGSLADTVGDNQTPCDNQPYLSDGLVHKILVYIHLFIKKQAVKSVLSRNSKIDKTKIIKTNGSLMKVKSIAECSLGAVCNTFDLH